MLNQNTLKQKALTVVIAENFALARMLCRPTFLVTIAKNELNFISKNQGHFLFFCV